MRCALESASPLAAGATLVPGSTAGAAATVGVPDTPWAAIRTVRPPEVTSSSPIPVRCTRRMSRRSSRSSKPPSFVSRELSTAERPDLIAPRVRGAGAAPRLSLPPRLTFQTPDQGPEAEEVTLGSKPLDHPNGRSGHQRRTTEWLARQGVGQVNFHHRHAGARHRVAQGHAGVREPPRVHEHAIGTGARPVERIDQHTLVLALETFHLAVEVAAELPDAAFDVVQGFVPVNFRLADAEGVQVWTVQDQDAPHQTRAPISIKADRTSRRSTGRGTLAWPTRGVNTQRTSAAPRFLSCRIARSRSSSATG